MTDKTISQLDNGGTVQATDDIPVVRSGANYRAQIGTAGTKAASDPSSPVVASVDGAVTVGHLAVFSDATGTVEDGGAVGGIITGASLLSPILTNDYVPVVRGGQIYLALVSAILAAQAPPSDGGQLNFSLAGNSGLLAGVL